MPYILRDLTIDPGAREVRRGADAIRLSDLTFEVLVRLIEESPEPLSHATLSQSVWGVEHVSDETVSQRVTLLRKALSDNPKEPIYIRTVRGLGYAIVGPVHWVEEGPPKDTPTPSKAKPALTAISCLAVVLVGSTLVWQAYGTGPTPPQAMIPRGVLSETSVLVSRANQQLGLHQAAETDRAISMLRDALSREPNHFDARLTLSFALSTKATKFGGGIEVKKEAEVLARKLIEDRPKNSNAWSALGYTLGSQGRMDESLSALQYAYQLDPKNAPAGSSAAHVLLVQGQLYEALKLEFEVLGAGGRSRYAEIQIAESLGLIKHPAAERWRTKALSFNPNQVVVLSSVARARLRKGNADAALKSLSLVKGEDNKAPSILQLRGRAKIALGRIEEAKGDLAAAGWRGRYDLAALDALVGDLIQAKALTTPAKLADLNSDPDPEFRIQLAETLAAMGKNDDALAMLEQGISLGWRDIEWLRRSPFLEKLASSDEWRDLEERITRELNAQRRLTEGDLKLAEMIVAG